MNWLANLHEAGRADHEPVGMELEARRFPGETDEVDQSTGMSIRVGDDVFILDVELREWPDESPVL